MPRHTSLLLNMLIVLGLALSGLLGNGAMPAGTSRVVASPQDNDEVGTGPALAGKRTRIKQDRRHDRRAEAKRDRKQDQQQADQTQAREQTYEQSAETEGRVGSFKEHCAGQDLTRLRRTKLCTHGPDETPPGFDLSQPVPLLPDRVAAEQTTAAAIGCDGGDGQSGYRTQVLYVRASDKPDNYAATVPSILAWAAETDLIFRASAAATGPTRSLRFVQDPATCLPTVGNVVVSPAAEDDFGTMINEFESQGYTRTDRIYLMFVDANVYCGVGTFYGDDQFNGNLNWNNFGPSYSRVDAGCWSGGVAAHEVMHNLGGVQDSAPHSSKGAHCIDEWDIMCYKDSPYFPDMQILCPIASYNWSQLDCNHDDYYNTNPAPGSYLATHWNPANNQFLTNALPPPPVVQPPPEEPTPKDKKKKKGKNGKKGKGKSKGRKRR